MRRRDFLLGTAAAGMARAADILPLADLRAGQRGVGRTVFAGDVVEEFEAEILGVLDNVWPKQSLILARLSGGPLERTGVMAGMSGSPVYVEGRLIGAVAFSFPFTTEPLCGIRPIEDMLAPAPFETAPRPEAVPLQALLAGEREILPARVRPPGTADGLVAIASPTAFGGFTERTLEVFGERLRGLGLRPMQGVGGRARGDAGADDKPVEPGSMISVGLIEGDLSMSAAGTVTLIEGDRIHAFGHPFLSVGPADLPMARASVLTLVPNLANSFKFASTGSPLGAITLDRSAGVAGRIGARASMVEAAMQVNDSRYRLQVARDPFLTPLLVQMAVFSVIDVTERQLGPSSLYAEGRVEFEGDAPPLDLGDVYSAASGVALQAALGSAAPLAFVLQGAAGGLVPRRLDLRMRAVPEQRTVRLSRAWTDREKARPGDSVEVFAVTRDWTGAESVHRTLYRIPPYQPAGELMLTLADATRTNMLEMAALSDATKLSPARLVEAVNRLRRSDALYLRVWRSGRGVRAKSARLDQPPASLLAVLESAAGRSGGAEIDAQSTLELRRMAGFDGVAEGGTTLKVVVTE